MNPIPVRATARLILRGAEERDLDDMAAILADAEVARFITFDGRPQNREYAWRMMALFRGHWALRGYGMWTLEDKSSGRCVGWAGCWFPEGWPEPEIGWTLARSVWGQGLAAEAARESLGFARDALGWRRVIHVIHPANARSIAVAERIGSRRTGTWVRDGKELDIYGQKLC
ncbi:MAG: GNAT family N-acetyltransferase [Rhodospirillaceae bacterium]|nr:GNAT family N-acetyltransferase [Rhodospirillaceae bacterium]